ncbi:hypothetical protein [uncultured Chloroflexus sp.]|uniref:hypothetical protein n=1 Tax=uncultured Chloroflexus sp. TaxID=214040 RepID=UPI002634A9D7|nr:hypothetical protein [uncultured Chloroflexus sp.]
MKTLGRILIIVGVAVLVAMGFNWLRVNHLLPVTQVAAREEGGRGRERSAVIFSGERENGALAGRGEHRINEAPSLANAGELGEALIKIGLITIVVVIIDRLIRLFKHRQRQAAVTS